MLETKREAFSLRDEIGTFPYFEVRLQLRDETPFFVRPYAIREEQKAVVQRENGQTGTSGNYRERANWIQLPGTVSQKKNNKISIEWSPISGFLTRDWYV